MGECDSASSLRDMGEASWLTLWISTKAVMAGAVDVDEKQYDEVIEASNSCLDWQSSLAPMTSSSSLDTAALSAHQEFSFSIGCPPPIDIFCERHYPATAPPASCLSLPNTEGAPWRWDDPTMDLTLPSPAIPASPTSISY